MSSLHLGWADPSWTHHLQHTYAPAHLKQRGGCWFFSQITRLVPSEPNHQRCPPSSTSGSGNKQNSSAHRKTDRRKKENKENKVLISA
ncbi:MAG: hypothetical protein Q8O46_05210 [bacterium]|nr:hypothetical protein [bacterium]